MSNNTLFHPKFFLYVEFMSRYQFVLKKNINSVQETIFIHTYISEKSIYLNVLYPQHIYFDLSKVEDFKTHEQRK